VFELPLLEQSVLVALVGHRQPRLVFEFGTYTGSTTLMLARSSPPDCRIHTVDLPSTSSHPDDDPIGSLFRNETGFSGKIVQHRCNLHDFDPSPWRAQAELVFIDASHQLDDVLHDSRTALELLAPSGVIVWDDYQPAQPGVVLALERLHRDLPIARIEGTRLAIYTPQPQPS
jgi:predicted O-methyltransferase YrrM